MLTIFPVLFTIISGALGTEQFEINWSNGQNKQNTGNASHILDVATVNNNDGTQIKTWIIGEIDWSQHGQETTNDDETSSTNKTKTGEIPEPTMTDKNQPPSFQASLNPTMKATTQPKTFESQNTIPATLATSSTSSPTTAPPSVTEKRTENKVKVTKSMIGQFQQSLRVFTAELFHQILQMTSPNDNIFFSPTSVSHAMGIISTGARGNSSLQIKESLKFEPEMSQEYIDALFKTVTNDKFSRKRKTDVITTMAARSFIQASFPVKKDFILSLIRYYNSGIESIDFAKPKSATDRINTWVEQNTNNLIKDLIPDGILDSLTRLVLVNVLYFKAPWVKQFYETQPRDFNTPTGPVKVPYLFLKTEFKVLENNNHVYIGIPYKDEKTFFFIMMPKSEKAMERFQKKANLKECFKYLRKKVVREWRYKKVALNIPKFTIEQSLDLRMVLTKMGVRDIFSQSNADLSGISDTFLYVTDFLHKARISVNKEGTEAAAASAGASGERSLVKSYLIDRPFIFGVFETDGDIIFMGKMVNPLAR